MLAVIFKALLCELKQIIGFLRRFSGAALSLFLQSYYAESKMCIVSLTAVNAWVFRVTLHHFPGFSSLFLSPSGPEEKGTEINLEEQRGVEEASFKTEKQIGSIYSSV